ncbi:MAG: dihydrodipicolinate synthase family protein [Paracoccaceae bacterium]
MASPLTGVMPVAPTVFHDDGRLDLPGNARLMEFMADQGSDAVCILANFSEQFLLTDEERRQVAETCLTAMGGRVPVIVTCSHFATAIAAARARHAADLGAAMVMLMPPYHGASLQADEDGIVEHFAEVARASGLPIMYQDAPLSGVKVSAAFLARLAREVPAVGYFKIETPFAAQKLRDLIALGGPAILGPCDGEESITLMADLDAGATGSMCSALLPDLIRPVILAHRAGDRAAAAEGYRRILPLINFENRQCGLRAAKVVLKEGGVIASDHLRHPLRPLHPATRAGLMELAREADPLALRWGK